MSGIKYQRKEVIGDCVLYQGDCLEILPEIGKVDAVVTDPPYGMKFISNHRGVKHDKIHNDSTAECLRFACGIPAFHSKYIFCRWDNLYEVPKPKSLITWVKNNWGMGDLEHEHARQTEVILFYPSEGHFFPAGRPQDIVRGVRTDNELHPTQKPLQLMQHIVKWTAGMVLDPFMGSGTTLVACAKLGRKGIGIELEPKYFDIACKRVEEAYKQPDLFLPPPKKAEQLTLTES